jgi:hypothetical protein
VAGFNYGDYNRTVAPGSNVQVEVYANKGIENMYQEVISRMEYVRAMQRQQAMNPRNRRTPSPAGDPFPVMPNFLISTPLDLPRRFQTKWLARGFLLRITRKISLPKARGLSDSRALQPGMAVAALRFQSVLLEPLPAFSSGAGRRPEAFYLECLHAMRSPSMVGKPTGLEELPRPLDV